MRTSTIGVATSWVTVLRLIEFVGFPFKHSEDTIRRSTVLDFRCERVGREILPGFLLGLFEVLLEDRLKFYTNYKP